MSTVAAANPPSIEEVLLGGQPVQYSGTMNSDTTTVSCDGFITNMYVNNCDATGVIHLSFDGGTTWQSISTDTYNVGPFNYRTQSFQYKASEDDTSFEMVFGVVGAGS